MISPVQPIDSDAHTSMGARGTRALHIKEGFDVSVMYVCPHCAAENRENANFCRECGNRRSSREAGPETEAMLCPCCCRRVRHADKFCMACGEKLNSRSTRDTKVCLSCKTILPPQATFCFSCGEYVATPSNRKVDLPGTDVFGDENPDFIPRYEA